MRANFSGFSQSTTFSKAIGDATSLFPNFHSFLGQTTLVQAQITKVVDLSPFSSWSSILCLRQPFLFELCCRKYTFLFNCKVSYCFGCKLAIQIQFASFIRHNSLLNVCINDHKFFRVSIMILHPYMFIMRVDMECVYFCTNLELIK